jgi:hypothetical protein
MNHIGCIFLHLICSIRITGTLSSPEHSRKNWHVVLDHSFPQYHTLFNGFAKITNRNERCNHFVSRRR